MLASVVVRFNLFAAAATAPRSAQARAQGAELAAGRALAEQQIRIEVQEAITDLEVAEASLETASRRVEAAEAAPTRSSRRSATSARCRRPNIWMPSAR